MRSAAMVVILAACSRQPVIVTPSMLHSYVPELRTRGKATIPVEPSGTFELGMSDVVRIQFGAEQKDVTVATLIQGCPDARPFANDNATRARFDRCGLLHVVEPITVDRRWRATGGSTILTIVGIVVVLAVVGVVVGYIDSCGEPDDGC